MLLTVIIIITTQEINIDEPKSFSILDSPDLQLVVELKF